MGSYNENYKASGIYTLPTVWLCAVSLRICMYTSMIFFELLFVSGNAFYFGPVIVNPKKLTYENHRNSLQNQSRPGADY